MAVNIRFPSPTTEQAPQLYNYSYDQLNRITGMDVYRGFSNSGNSWSGLSATTDYKERVSYDPNGNILKYMRNGISSINTKMDSLTYNYYTGTNRLKYVKDSVPDNIYATLNGNVDDINNQTNTSNYTYTPIGNMITDRKDSVTSIQWNVYGKITDIVRSPSSAHTTASLQYYYDAMGNRIGKRLDLSTDNIYYFTWYVRDAQGNIMATYSGSGAASNNPLKSNYSLTLGEQNIYGSSRIGVVSRNVNMKSTFSNPSITNFERGDKSYELSNHLGNVLATISDKKVPNVTAGVVNAYSADIITANDYYPFGMLMPGRKFLAASSSKYRFGFNGKENDNDVKGEGNEQDYGMRIYDTRIGKFLSVDPLIKKYPELTPYQFASNTPLQSIDLDGLERLDMTNVNFLKRTATITIVNQVDIVKENLATELQALNGTTFSNLFTKGNSTLYTSSLPANGQPVNFIAQEDYAAGKGYAIEVIYDLKLNYVNTASDSKFTKPEVSVAYMMPDGKLFSDNNAFAISGTASNDIGINPEFAAFAVNENIFINENYEELIAHEVGFHNMLGQKHKPDKNGKSIYPANETTLESNEHGRILPTQTNTKELLKKNITDRSNLNVKLTDEQNRTVRNAAAAITTLN